jgi:long-chain acyl-CoA synthetase
MPKGVILTHRNILANIEAAVRAFTIGPDDTCLSFLPLSHVFERVEGYYLMLHQGAVIAYAESIDTVPANLLEIRPTLVISVPRLYEKMFARIMERVLSGPWLKKQLFFGAIRVGRAYTREVLADREPALPLRLALAVARTLVFAKLKERLGGRLRFFISGGAPLVRNVAEFFLAADIPIYEGYGLTETAAGVTVNTPRELRLGTVGKPLFGAEIRLAEDGEILLRGPGVFSGYWNLPDATAEAFRDGWFQTGDIGELDRDGYLAITDRKKDLIVTAGGKNIAPQNLENRFKSDKYLSNAMVYGDRKPYLTALLVPNFENLEKYARYKKIDFLNHCDLVSHSRVLDLVRRRINRLQAELPSFTQVKRFTLLSRDFTGEEGEVTPTLKIKRKVVTMHFQQVLEGMYLAQGKGIHDSGFCIVDDNNAGGGTPE